MKYDGQLSDHMCPIAQGAQLFWYEDKAAAMATIQVPLIVALAGKNNVLSFLTGVGHEKVSGGVRRQYAGSLCDVQLNILHRTSARTCLILLWIHALGHITQGYVLPSSLYHASSCAPRLPAKFDFSHDWMRSGAVGLGGFTMATILSIRPLRHIGFEFFLIGHIVFILCEPSLSDLWPMLTRLLFRIFLIGGYHHVPDFSPEMRGYIWPAFVFWGIDRAQRVGRILLNNTIWRGTNPEHSHGTVELISDDTLKLTLRRSMNWKAGQHAYVILPSVSTLPIEAHPVRLSHRPSVAVVDNYDSSRLRVCLMHSMDQTVPGRRK
jgi:ferric-chelate reductase